MQTLTKINPTPSLMTCLESTNLAWDAEQTEIMSTDGHMIPSHKLIRRADTKAPLGVVGSKYGIVQNSSAFSLIEAVVDQSKGKFESGGFTGKGSRVVLQAKIGKEFKVDGDGNHGCYLTCINSFDGSSAMKAYFTTIRLSCMNQINASLDGAVNMVSVRHTANAEAKLDEAIRILSIGSDFFTIYKAAAEKLVQTMVDKAMVETFLNKVVGEVKTIDKKTGEEKISTRIQNQRDHVLELFKNGIGNRGKTAYDLVNGVTEWVDHHKKGNINSMLFGKGSTIKQSALDVALSL